MRNTWVKIFLASLWCVCVYRAVTQSIVHDEAYTFALYLTRDTRWIFKDYDPNNHFLNTLLMKASVWLFGVKEWSLRVPALAGAGLYFAAVYRLCTRALQTTVGALLAAAFVTLNPFILDLMVAARGYGLALAFWMWALIWSLGFMEEATGSANLVKAGVALVLSIAANLTFLVPAAVLAGALLVVQIRRRTVTGGRARPIAFVILAACICGLFFAAMKAAHATGAFFYVGYSTISQSLRNLTGVSLSHGFPFRYIPQIAPLAYWMEAVAFCIAPAAVVGALIAGAKSRDPLLLLISACALGSAAILAILHALAGVPYPGDRTGLYFLVLAPLALMGLADWCASMPGYRVGAIAAYALALVITAQFALQFDTHRFLTWEYDADNKQILERLAQEVKDKHSGAVRVSASWLLEPSLNFYRRTWRLTWMREVTRDPVAAGADYYILNDRDRAAADTLGLRRIYEGPTVGNILAAAPGR